MKIPVLVYILVGILLVSIPGYFFMTGMDHHEASSPNVPEFQPGIWDQPVIHQPYNSSASLFAYPYMFQYDMSRSSGFAIQYRKYYRLTFVIAPGKNATVVLNVTSYSRNTITVSLAAIDDLPADVITYVQPATIVLLPGKSGNLAIDLHAPPDAGRPRNSEMNSEGEIKLPVGVWLESEDWQIGQGFYLKLLSGP